MKTKLLLLVSLLLVGGCSQAFKEKWLGWEPRNPAPANLAKDRLLFPGGVGYTDDEKIGTQSISLTVRDFNPDFTGRVCSGRGNESLTPNHCDEGLTGTRTTNAHLTMHLKGHGYIIQSLDSNGNAVEDPECPGPDYTPPGQCHYIMNQGAPCDYEYDFVGYFDEQHDAHYTYKGTRCGEPISGSMTLPNQMPL